ncbi:MAG TPA: DciA family protein [Streptosporangiaceae bacterium]|nr:DciA family protein [Streptosporangiaceae bacterium]
MPPDRPGPAGRSKEQAAAPVPLTDEPPQPVKGSRLTLAAEALAQAKADAEARGVRPAAPAQGDFAQRGRGAASPSAGLQSRRHRRDDPAPLSSAIDGLVAETGWELAVATGSVFGRWAQIVGPDLAAHTSPDGLVDGELTVVADSTAWATQLRLLAAELVRKLNAELGDGSVRRVNVRGPGAQSRRPGQWRVRGSRGPRDTYG